MYGGAWSIAGAVYFGIFVAQGSRWQTAAVSVAVNVVTAASLGALVVVAARALPADLGWRRAAGIHVGLAAIFAVAWLGAVGLGLSVVVSLREGAWTAAPLTGAAIPWQLFAGLLVYVATAAATTASRHAAALAEQRELAIRAEAARVRAELDALHARFQPHFLFNSLHGIATLVRHDRERGVEALEGLGDLLRATLRVSGGDADEHTLADEWAIVTRYVDLERLRLGERLRLEAALDPDALECLVPAFLLQPMIENAIRHAVAPRTSGATIRVTATMAGETLQVSVEDDGPGAGARPAPVGAGIGLDIVRERLATLHPDEASLDVAPRPGGGFRVDARLPARRSSEAA